VCHKSYTQFSNLCRHKRMHADCRTQIKCKDCGQMFSTTSSLNKHRRFCEGKNHFGSPVGMFNPGIPMSSSPIMAKAKSLHPQHHLGLNHAGLGFTDYFTSRPHLHAGLPFSTGPHGFPSLSHGFPGLFAPSLYPRPPLPPPNPLLKSPLGPERKMDRGPLDAPPLSLMASMNSNGGGGGGGGGLSQGEDKEKDNKLDVSSSGEVKSKSKMADMSDGSDLEDVNTTSGTDLDTTTGTASGDGSDLDSDGESERERSGKRRKASHAATLGAEGVRPEDMNSPLVSAMSNAARFSMDRPFLSKTISQHSFFPPPDEQALPPSTSNAHIATTDSIKAIASIAEKYFGPGLMGLHQEKKMGPLPYHSMFPFQFLPNFPHSLYPFSTDRGALNPGMFFKPEPKLPREPLHKMAPVTPAPPPVRTPESAFDLTTKAKEAKLVPPTPPKPSNPNGSAGGPLAAAAGSEEQPLDLSIGSRRRSGPNGVASEPPSRKHLSYGSNAGKGAPAAEEPPSGHMPAHSQPPHPSPMALQHHQALAHPPQQSPLHYAKPSAFFMDPIYRYFSPDLNRKV